VSRRSYTPSAGHRIYGAFGVQATCCHTMTVGSRKRSERGARQRSYTTSKGKHVPCPRQADVVIDGRPYCAVHAPKAPDV
jgi:hypothetical protein